jgi:3-hydroxybutyryl-CoA dehydrogenase
MKSIERIAIAGAGLMGHGIAEVFLAHGPFQVTLYDTVSTVLESAPGRIQAIAQSLSGSPCDLTRLRLSSSLAKAVADAELVIEAIPEKLELKQQFFHRVEEHAPSGCIFASNTSVIPITAIGEKLRDKSRLVGTHWWNPPYLIPLVEVVQTAHTHPAVIQVCMELLTGIGKSPVHVKKDVPGFVANRLQHALWREAIAIVEAGICDAETVDRCIKNSFGLRLSVLGPLENADLVGLEMTEDIHRVILPALSAAREPSPLLRRMVQENHKGWATNAGFYVWSEASKAEVRKRLTERLQALLHQGEAQS